MRYGAANEAIKEPYSPMKPLLSTLSIVVLTLLASVPALAQSTAASVPPTRASNPSAVQYQYCDPALGIGPPGCNGAMGDVADDAADDSLTASTAVNDAPDPDEDSVEGVANAAEPTRTAAEPEANETVNTSARLIAEAESGSEVEASRPGSMDPEEGSGKQASSVEIIILPDTGGVSTLPLGILSVGAGLLVRVIARSVP
jgi:hypothetical protein